MVDISTHYSGKLYDKEGIIKWDLPKKIVEKLEMDKHDFFFIMSNEEAQHGAQIHVHLSIYPSKFNNVYLLEVELPKIKPDVLHKTLSILKEVEVDIVTSTGFCQHEKSCHYGVFFSTPEEINKKDLCSKVKAIEEVERVNIFVYSCQGCSEL